jgi:transcriptional repressor NrdR
MPGLTPLSAALPGIHRLTIGSGSEPGVTHICEKIGEKKRDFSEEKEYNSSAMYCPVCNNKDSKVVDSRISTEGVSVRRRRECEKCAYRFSTLEEVELLDITVVKRDGRREGYRRDKLLAGLKHSMHKRSFTDEKFDKLVRNIERDIQKKKRSQLTSEEIGEIVMRHLKRFDKVAYIRFASVYRLFEDVKTFEAELATLVRKQTRKKVTKKTSGKSGTKK